MTMDVTSFLNSCKESGNQVCFARKTLNLLGGLESEVADFFCRHTRTSKTCWDIYSMRKRDVKLVGEKTVTRRDSYRATFVRIFKRARFLLTQVLNRVGRADLTWHSRGDNVNIQFSDSQVGPERPSRYVEHYCLSHITRRLESAIRRVNGFSCRISCFRISP